MKKITVAVALLSLILSGCSAFVPKTQTISATCSEPDAILQINTQQFKGVAQTEVRRNKTVSIMCTKPGFFPAQKSIDKSLSGTAIADIVGTFIFLLPGLGLFSAGAWSLDETNINVPMIPNQSHEHN